MGSQDSQSVGSEDQDQFDEENFDQVQMSGYQSDMDTLDHEQMVLPEYIIDVLANNKDEVLSIKKSPANKNLLLVGSMDDTITLVNIDNSEMIFQNQYKETVSQVEWNFDGSLMACSTMDNQILVLDGKDPSVAKFTFSDFEDEINYIETHKQGNFLIACSRDSTFSVFNIQKGELLQQFFGHLESVNKASFTPNKRIVSVSDDQTLKLWKLGQSTPEFEIKDGFQTNFHTGPIFDFSIHEQLLMIVTLGLDGFYCISSLEKPTVFHRSLEIEDLQSSAIDTKRNSLNVCTLKGDIILYDMAKNFTLYKSHVEGQLVKTKYWSDRNIFATISSEGELFLNGLGDSKITTQTICDSALHDMEIIDDNLLALAAEDSHIYFYDIRKGIFDKQQTNQNLQ